MADLFLKIDFGLKIDLGVKMSGAGATRDPEGFKILKDSPYD